MVWITLERKVSIPIAEGTPSHVGHICMVMYTYVSQCIHISIFTQSSNWIRNCSFE